MSTITSESRMKSISFVCKDAINFKTVTESGQK